MKHIFLLMGVFLLFSIMGMSQEVNFTTSVAAKKVGVTDRFQVTYSSSKQGQFIAPKYKNFKQVGGVSRGSNSSVNIVNGQMTQTQTFQYTLVLQPIKTGVFEVEGAKIKVEKATYESKSVEVEVVEESQARQRRRSSFDPFGMMDEMMRGMPQSRPRQIEITDKDLFAKISVSKGNVMKGEGFLVTYKVYARDFNFGIENYDFPTQEDFWTENIKTPEQIKPTNEILDGVRYQVYTLKKELLFPQKSGELKLNSFGIKARIQTSPFSSPLTKEVKSNAPVIKVNPLPKNAPSSFVNQIGSYSMDVKMASDSFVVNEPIDYTIHISGKGNLKQLSQLEIDFPKELEVYDPEIDNKLSVSESGVKGSKSFNYLLIPRKSGKFSLPEVSFTYFDLESKSYKTILHPAQEIVVTNPDGSAEMVDDSSETEEDKQSDANTISLDLNSLWIGLATLGVLGLGIVLFLFISKRKGKEETEEVRRKNARKKLSEKLSIAKSHLEKNEVSQFYNEILVGLNKYVNEKLGIETSKMTKQTIRQTLSSKGVGKETTDSFVEVLEQSEMAKYAPLSNQNNEEIYEKSLDVIEEIESQI
ncbi:MAG: BatD family protein [Flavobacteriales bacterium]